jgi:hypothetical protein
LLLFCRKSNTLNHICFNLLHVFTAPSRSAPPHFRGFTITLGGTALDEWSARCRDLYRQQTRLKFLGGIRTRNLSKQAAADPHLRLRDHWGGRSGYYL